MDDKGEQNADVVAVDAMLGEMATPPAPAKSYPGRSGNSKNRRKAKRAGKARAAVKAKIRK